MEKENRTMIKVIKNASRPVVINLSFVEVTGDYTKGHIVECIAEFEWSSEFNGQERKFPTFKEIAAKMPIPAETVQKAFFELLAQDYILLVGYGQSEKFDDCYFGLNNEKIAIELDAIAAD